MNLRPSGYEPELTGSTRRNALIFLGDTGCREGLNRPIGAQKPAQSRREYSARAPITGKWLRRATGFLLRQARFRVERRSAASARWSGHRCA